MLQSLDIEKNSDGSISDFRSSGQSLINKNCHNSRTSNYIDVAPRAVTTFEKKNKGTSKNTDDEVMLETFDVIVIFSINGKLGVIGRLDIDL